MNKVQDLLFEQVYGTERIQLFLNRQDLLNKLLTNELSAYRVRDANNSVEYARSSNRLQTYLSHILTGSGKRKITDDFTQSLTAIVAERLKGTDINAEFLVDNIIAEIESLNTTASHRENALFDEFVNDQKTSKYIAVFTTAPIELEANPNVYLDKIRSVVIDTILNYDIGASSPSMPITKYKYNFPERITGILFWRKLSLLIVRKVLRESLEDKLDGILRKLNLVYRESNNKTIEIYEKVNQYLTYCNNQNWIQVNLVQEPIFVMPHVVFNPNETNNIKAYLLLGYKDETIQLHKLSTFDSQIWRQYVWNVLKEKRTSVNIKYIDSIENGSPLLDLNNL